ASPPTMTTLEMAIGIIGRMPMPRRMIEQAIERLREGLRGTPYEGRVYLVGGYVRDKLLGRPLPNDLDLVLEGDALELAQWLYDHGLAEHDPVVYPRFGTAMVKVSGVSIELVTARAESYRAESRKPVQVKPATLLEDALRRDFTINTLLENLHTGEVLDPLGRALPDLKARLIRTPCEPKATFYEDPLRMLRAVRFAVQLGFEIESETYQAICTDAPRLAIISRERIRDEFTRILEQPDAARGLQMLLDTGLLKEFAQPLLPMVGCTQNRYHQYDVWTHSLKAVEALSHLSQGGERSSAPIAPWELRLATLLHDVGKPATRTVDEQGEVHFYGHARVGTEIARQWLREMKYPNATIERVCKLIALHMRPGEYSPQWSDAAVRRLMRDAGELLEPLLQLVEADIKAQRADLPHADLQALRARIEQIRAREAVHRWQSPLSGEELMHQLGLKPGPLVGRLKEALTELVLEGKLAPDDRERALQLAQELLRQWQVPSDAEKSD
ncbi:MAG: CCA tRNA nucleotidyltransferase, partial [Fimbriimonadales bacterium]|nr:CCA tRNA nucleotidyltransferase [Fimbriimonadales bacterium]